MFLRLIGIAAVLAVTLVGLGSGHLRVELYRLHADMHRLRDYVAAQTRGQPAYTAYTFPASSIDRVVVDTAKVQRTIPKDFFGINYVAFWDSSAGSAASARALRQTPIRTVRFPGGAPADWYDWQDPYYKGWSHTSPLQLWHWARSFGARHVLFSTNYQGNIPKPAGKSYAVNSPRNAAAWVAFNKRHGITAAMEVGNEEDLKTLNQPDDPAYAPYIAAFNAQAKAMHRVDARVQVLGPVGTNEYYWWTRDGLGMFLARAGNRTGTDQVNGVSLHFYKGSSWFDSKGVAQYWLSSTGPWRAIQTAIRAHDTRRLPVYITEWNSGPSDSNNAFTPTIGHALVVSDMLGAFAQSGVAGEDYFDLHGASGWGLLYGPNESRPVDTPTPTYYAMALWNQMGNTVLRLQQSDDPANVMSAYATKSRDGSVQVLVANKRPTSRTVRIAFQGQTPAGHSLQVYSLRGATNSVDGLDTVYDGVGMPSPQHHLPGPRRLGIVRGSTASYTLPPYSAAVLVFHRLSRSPRIQWKPIPTATSLPPLAVKLSASVMQSQLKPGQTQVLEQRVQANDVVEGLLADFEVYDGSGTKVFETTQPLHLRANHAVTVTQNYTLPSTAYGGTYHYKAGVFGLNWQPTLAWIDNAGTFTVAGPPVPRISVAGSVDPHSLPPGGTVGLSAQVRAADNSLPNALVDFELYSDTGAKICQAVKTGVDVPAGETVTVPGSCSVPGTQPNGRLTLKIGVFGPNWSPTYAWNNNADSLTVTAGRG